MPPVSDASLRTGGSASSSPNKSSPPEPESRLAHDSTPIFTPSTTPSSETPQQDEIREKDNSRAPQTDRTGHLETMSPPNSPGGATVVVTPETKEETAAVDENTASKLEPHAAPNVSETTSAKPVCKRHTAKGNKSAKKHVNKCKRKNKNLATDSSNSSSDLSTTSASDSSSSTSSSSESESESESEEDTDSETEEKEKRKGHKKAKKNFKNKKGNKQKRKSKGSHRKHDDLSETSSDENSEDDSVAEKAQRKTSSKLRAKKKAKKVKLDDEISEDIEEEQNQIDPDNLAYIQEQLAALGLKCTGLAQKSRRRANDDKPTKNNGKKAAKSKGKRASKVAYKRVDQLWDNTIHNYKLTETMDDPDTSEWDQYIFTVRRSFDWDNKYVETVVDIKSKPLREALSKIMNGVKGVSLVQETAAVDPNMLFLYLEETRQYMKDLRAIAKSRKKKKERKQAQTKADHLKVLVKYMDKDYAETKKTLYPLLDANMITFDLLWALYKPNSIAYTSTYGDVDEPRAFKIEYASKESSFMRGQWYSVEGRYLEYDGKSFGMGTMSADVGAFKGARKITSLACYPLKYHRDSEAIKQKLIERGKKFASLTGMNYRFHKGMAFYKKRGSIIKVNINGRVMVDPATHRRINPNYPVSTVKTRNDLDGSDDSSDACGCGLSGSGSESGQGFGESNTFTSKSRIIRDGDGKTRIEAEFDENGKEVGKGFQKIDSEGDCESDIHFSEENLLIASPVVLGFAFSEKLWLELSVSGINEIEWNEGAFDSLVLPDNQKTIVRALVESHTFHAAENIDDVIQGKGKGLVAVLHGPPGTGKTLTAEGIAELLKRPLYMVSAGELGTNSQSLEGELTKILDIAHSWGAVLLLDEADVFLEKRTIHDIHRNALVSIFLRLLEYFQGILFLTTNRVETFDEAFQSRIHIALRYGDLNTKAKRAIWKMFLRKVQAMDGLETVTFTEKDYDELARHNLNGRQIKNSVRTAQALAINEKAPLSMTHIKCVLEVAETFDRDLKGGTGYLDAMRSYT
ncbi:hypothetical protein DTO164E3_1353 [Paecilomyces variotii]|nr:hypothetical protein DTO032I3_4477 [Paecilomyces variotii]KAJ9205375.1 hypothetical protein DTO164E3_1353 [Paecilomyces variotii]KAJ9280493.1 hypothetical protein DTO021D3_2713 [Paecilomyces variotii]KAJ9346870.1 hypothetical protein DTO027B6_437 [Paecilomyces variotii]KAJ9354554.1 hypothetical protein DTO027B9_4590 [Paecilomyces variotii]